MVGLAGLSDIKSLSDDDPALVGSRRTTPQRICCHWAATKSISIKKSDPLQADLRQRPGQQVDGLLGNRVIQRHAQTPNRSMPLQPDDVLFRCRLNKRI